MGTFVGIVGSKFRFTAGDGGDTNAASDSDTAVISIDLPDARVPLDGAPHEVACLILTSEGYIRLYIDSTLVATAAATNEICNHFSATHQLIAAFHKQKPITVVVGRNTPLGTISKPKLKNKTLP